MAATVEALRRAVPLLARGPVARVARPDPRRRDVISAAVRSSGACSGEGVVPCTPRAVRKTTDD
jgi:hypothetical protein